MKKKKILKIILIIILIILVLFLIHTARNFIIIKGVQNNFSKYENSSNYHIKSVAKESTDTTVTMDYYTKDEKQVMKMERNIDGEILKVSMYSNGEKVNVFYDNPSGKTCQLNLDTEVIQVNLYNHLETENIWQTLLGSITTNIKSEEYNGKDCYIVNGFMSPLSLTEKNINEVHIEKDTGLFIKSVIDSNTTEREYEFNNVEDSVFEEPDISEYSIQENE